MVTDLQEVSGLNILEESKAVLADIENMPAEKLTALCDAEPGIMTIFDKARKELEKRYTADPDSVPGWGMVPGPGANVWNDSEENIVKALKGRRLKRDDIYPPKLISPAQVLKSDKLKKEQKERIEKDLITYKVGKEKFTRIKDSDTGKEKISAEAMLAEVDFLSAPAETVAEEPVAEEISFM